MASRPLPRDAQQPGAPAHDRSYAVAAGLVRQNGPAGRGAHQVRPLPRGPARGRTDFVGLLLQPRSARSGGGNHG